LTTLSTISCERSGLSIGLVLLESSKCIDDAKRSLSSGLLVGVLPGDYRFEDGTNSDTLQCPCARASPARPTQVTTERATMNPGPVDPGVRAHGRQIQQYYAAFNERRFADAAAMFADDAVVEQTVFQQPQRGGAGYLYFTETWIRAFPDASIAIERVIERSDAVYEVELLATGTHLGQLQIGGLTFSPGGVEGVLHLRELLEFRGGRIVMSSVSFDFQELVNQLVRVDEAQLLTHLGRIRQIEEHLRAAAEDPGRRRELIARLGTELDGARRVVRPYYFGGK
jgi:predicted ester cyclase